MTIKEIYDGIDAKEKLGRDTYAKYVSECTGITDYQLEFTPIDCNYDFLQTATTLDAKEHYYVGEIKMRNEPSTRFPTAYLEVSKCNALLSYARKHNSTPVYINFWSDNKVTTFNLNTDLKGLEPKWRFMRKNNYEAEEVCKQVYELPIKSTREYA